MQNPLFLSNLRCEIGPKLFVFNKEVSRTKFVLLLILVSFVTLNIIFKVEFFKFPFKGILH